jgi:hypothetical protein
MKLAARIVAWIFVHTLRRALSWASNKVWRRRMRRAGEYDVALREVGIDAAILKTLDDVFNTYERYYTKYKNDPLKGGIDQSNTVEVIRYRGCGDCDDMAEVFRWLLKNHVANDSIAGDVSVYAFLVPRKLPAAISKAHVMCVLDRRGTAEKRYVLCDYAIYHYDEMDDIKRHYAEGFFEGQGIEADDVIMVKIPDPGFPPLPR